MTLFTAVGLLRAYQRSVAKGMGGALNTISHHSFLRWLHSQGLEVYKDMIEQGIYDIESGWLIKQKELFKRREQVSICE